MRGESRIEPVGSFLSRFLHSANVLLAVSVLLILASMPLCALGSAERESFTPDDFRRSVSRELGISLDECRTVIADATWLWYDQKQEHRWNRKSFDYAVSQGVENCSNPAILAAAKTGKFGEKLLKALIVTAGDAAEGFSAWLERNSGRYEN